MEVHIISCGKLLAATKLSAIPPVGSTIRFYGTGSDFSKMIECVVDSVVFQCFVRTSDLEPSVSLLCTVFKDNLPRDL